MKYIRATILMLGLLVCPRLGAETKAPALNDVLESADAHYPAVLAALRDLESAEGAALAADGAFDTRLKLRSRNDPFGFYETRTMEALIEQPTRYRGASFFGGWRRGDGLFPLQEEKVETQSGGEALFGMSVPLLRDGAIDSARAGVSQTEIGILARRARVDLIRLNVQQAAAAQFHRWRAASEKRAAREDLLDLALVRDKAIRDQVELGEKAEVEIVDNQRVIVTRREGILKARQKEQQEAVRLSLFWRDAEGEPLFPEEYKPEAIPAGALPAMSEPVEKAIAAHPEIRILDRELSAAGIRRTLSRNQILPKLDLSMSVSKDLGHGSRTKEQTEFRIGAFLEFPFQNRKARGSLAKAAADISSLEQDRRLLSDQLRAAALAADLNMKRIEERLRRLEERLDLTKQMRTAENDRLDLQLSDVFRLNLREQDVMAAEVDLIDARLELKLAQLAKLGALAVNLLETE